MGAVLFPFRGSSQNIVRLLTRFPNPDASHPVRYQTFG